MSSAHTRNTRNVGRRRRQRQRHALHGFSTTWKRDDDDVDTVRDGKREPVSMVRDYYDYYDYYDDDYYDAEAATANEGWRFRFLVSRGSLGGRGKSACDASDD